MGQQIVGRQILGQHGLTAYFAAGRLRNSAVRCVCLSLVTVLLAASCSAQIDATPKTTTPTTTAPTTATSKAMTAELLTQTKASVVLLDAVACGMRLQGSGTIVRIDGHRRLLTNRHVIANAESLQVGGVDLDPSQALRSPKFDLASIEVEPSFAPVVRELEIAQQDVTVGEEIILFGYAADRRLLTKRAKVQLVSDGLVYGYAGSVMLIDQLTEPGFSGGAVLNDEGRLVGLLMALDQATGLSLAIPLDILRSATTYDQMVPEVSSC